MGEKGITPPDHVTSRGVTVGAAIRTGSARKSFGRARTVCAAVIGAVPAFAGGRADRSGGTDSSGTGARREELLDASCGRRLEDPAALRRTDADVDVRLRVSGLSWCEALSSAVLD